MEAVKSQRIVVLTENQIRLLLGLLFDHSEDGTYWGNKEQHYAMVERTRKALDPNEEFQPK